MPSPSATIVFFADLTAASLREMEQMHEERKQAAVDLLEDKYEKRIALMSRIQQQTEAAKHTLEIENIALKVSQNTQYRPVEKLTPCSQMKHDAMHSAATAPATPGNTDSEEVAALKSKCALLSSLMEGLEETKQKAVTAERQRIAEQFANERRQLEANFQIDTSKLKAQVEQLKVVSTPRFVCLLRAHACWVFSCRIASASWRTSCSCRSELCRRSMPSTRPPRRIARCCMLVLLTRTSMRALAR
jgi:hypothetical protein